MICLILVNKSLPLSLLGGNIYQYADIYSIILSAFAGKIAAIRIEM